MAKDPSASLLKCIDCRGYTGFYTLSPDGKLLAYSDQGYLVDYEPRADYVLVDTVTGKELARRGGKGAHSGMFSPDGKRLVISSDVAGISVWDVGKWEPAVALKPPQGQRCPRPLAFSPDGKTVAGFTLDSDFPPRKYRLVLWDAATGQPRLLGGDAERPKVRLMPHQVLDPVLEEAHDLAFADDGNPYLFGHYPHSGDFRRMDGRGIIAAWDVTRGRILAGQHFPAMDIWDTNIFGLSDTTIPRSALDLYRLRLSRSGWLVALPKYRRPPFVVGSDKKDGTIRVYLTPFPPPGMRREYPELGRLDEFKEGLHRSYRITEDGKRLVIAGVVHGNSDGERESKGKVYIWDIARMQEVARQKAVAMSAAQRERLWEQLFREFPHIDAAVSGDSANLEFDSHQSWTSQDSMMSLVAQPNDAVPWLRKRLGPPLDRKRVPRLLEQLESRKFPEREEASRLLQQWAPMIRPELEAGLKGDPPPDKRKRLTEILDHVKETAVCRELLTVRVVDVLEHIRTDEARTLLKLLADGSYGDGYAQEAKKALKRTDPQSQR